MSNLPVLFDEDHVCDACGVAYLSLSPDQCLDLVASAVGELEGILPRLTEEELRGRHSSDEWSPIEYACHVRDVLVVFTVRVHRGVHDDRPVVDPMYNDWRAERFGYRSASVATVLEGMRSGAAGLAAEVRSVPEGAWDRVVTRLPGEDRTVRWLVRQAAHEAEHHVGDVRRILSAASRECSSSPVSSSVFSADRTPIQPAPATLARVIGASSSRSWIVVSRQVRRRPARSPR